MKLQLLVIVALTAGMLVCAPAVHAKKESLIKPAALTSFLEGLDTDDALFYACDVAMVAPAIPMGIVTAGLHTANNALKAIKHATIDNHPYFTAAGVLVPLMAATVYIALQEGQEMQAEPFEYDEMSTEQIIA